MLNFKNISYFFTCVSKHALTEVDEFYDCLNHMKDKEFSYSSSLIRIGEELNELKTAHYNFRKEPTSGNFTLFYDEVCDVMNYCLVHYLSFEDAWEDIAKPIGILSRYLDDFNISYEFLIHSLVEKSHKHQLFVNFINHR